MNKVIPITKTKREILKKKYRKGNESNLKQNNREQLQYNVPLV